MAQHQHLDVELAHKLDVLCESLNEFDRLAVAFSGGVDSSLLLKVASDVLGDGVMAMTGRSPSMPQRELDETVAFCNAYNIRQVIVDTHEFELEGFDHNPPDRCYHCKRELLSCIRDAAAAYDIWVVAEGSNLDDQGDYRPGFRAIKELDIVSPLRGAGMTKADVRSLAKHLGLPNWNKPAFACLNSRFAYGEHITFERLDMVDKAETFLRDMGFENVRVRFHDNIARIEVSPSDINKLVEEDARKSVSEKLKSLGFLYVSVDLEGYRIGSMNDTL